MTRPIRPVDELTPVVLGENLRAARLGFGWAADLDAWLRIADDGELFRIDLAPARADLPTKPAAFRAWWDGDDADIIVAAIRAAAPPALFDGAACSFTIDDDGTLVEDLSQ